MRTILIGIDLFFNIFNTYQNYQIMKLKTIKPTIGMKFKAVLIKLGVYKETVKVTRTYLWGLFKRTEVL